MKKRIYLFCNNEYGSAYLKAFQTYVKKLPDYEFYVVFSTKKIGSGYLRKFAVIIRHPVSYGYGFYQSIKFSLKGLKEIKINNINCPNFFNSVPTGSIGFVAGFNQIFRKSTIDRFSSLINFHPSLLPYYRGSIPSYWVIKNDEKTTGFTAHFISEKIDAGEIVYQESVEVNQGISEVELDYKISVVGSFYFSECLRSIAMKKPFRQSYVNTPYLKKVDYVSAVRED